VLVVLLKLRIYIRKHGGKIPPRLPVLLRAAATFVVTQGESVAKIRVSAAVDKANQLG
jgi:hypothetical protein